MVFGNDTSYRLKGIEIIVKIQQLISEALRLPNNAIAYHVSQELAALYPSKAMLEEG
ncbi:hypothetical protein [Fischerella major]|uniref:hypothetical protein n=1 Tax=Fischerella major TaxID=210993 RepID=UPI0015BDB5BA|nr:hypothetical protein [Fischerella major]